MILSGKEILAQIREGNIDITPFNERFVNPNSYNLRLHNELLVYTDEILDMQKPLNTKSIMIPEDGLLLQPGKLYLGRTYEKTCTNKYVPMLEGRSSIGRLGLFIHVTAGFGDIGFSGFWTLEIQCIHPVKIYPMVEIGQIYYHTLEGDFDGYDSGKYQNNTGIQPSLLYRDFKKKEKTGIEII
ncbi:MAG: dCTP deaminase [Lachnospiraceae bacterium]|nr:dCTP deaminase [Lachnospiraceae bacterium]